MRWLYLPAIAIFLSGCAAPAGFTFASLAADSGSLLMSGKTLTDHGLSLAMKEDCALMRVLDDVDEICRDEPGQNAAASVSPHSWEDAGLAQLALRVHRARTQGANYLTAGMIEPQI